MKIEITIDEPKLEQAVELVNNLNKEGYNTYFKGRGNGEVKVMVEHNKIIPSITIL